jgi:YD repeat-containing protein
MKLKLIVAIFFLSWNGICQTTQVTQLQDFAPKSPEAAAFLKYGEYSVDLSTGLTNINIPIYTVKTGDYELPISLSYHPSGIKVGEEATWVGLGWNLNAGAQIILEVRDAPDEYNESYNTIPNANDVQTYMTNNPLGYFHSYFQNLKSESWVRDVYNFSSPTANGKFIIDNSDTNQITIYPPDAFKVEIVKSLGKDGFKITDINGNIYTFDTTREYSQTLQQYQPPLYKSAWFVDKIETPNHNIIDFIYTNGGNISQNSFTETINHTITETPNFTCIPGAKIHTESISSPITTFNTLYTETKKIEQIIFNGGRVLFNSSSGRLDYNYTSNNNDLSTLANGVKKLDLIEIQSKNNLLNTYTTIKDCSFNYSYFISNQLSNDIFSNGYRLKLDKITFKSIAISNSEETLFTYSTIELPTKDSKSTDFYGYFNGKSNLSRIPHQIIKYSPSGIATSYESIGNADRQVNPLTIEAGILKEIKYPTKGITKFEYEPNTYYGINKFEKFTEHIVSGNTVQGIGSGTRAPKELPGYGDEYSTICNQSPSIGCIQYLVIPFEAVNADGVISFQVNNPVGNDPTLTKYQYARVRIFDSTGEIYNSGNLKSSTTINASITINGQCNIVVEAYGSYMSVIGTQLKYYNSDPNPKNNYGSGLRIKSITNLNHTSEIITKKIYEYTNNLNQSAGLLVNDIYTTFQSNSVINYFASCCSAPTFGCAWASNTTSSFTSNSINGIESNSVIYTDVKEKSISTNNTSNGYSQYKFSTDADYLYDTRGIIKVDAGYKRGKLLSKEIFKESSSGNLLLINKLTNEYAEDNQKITFVQGFKLFQHAIVNGTLINNTLPIPLDVIFEPISYSIPVNWFYQKATESTDYFYNSSNVLSGSMVNRTNYFYDNPNHLQLTRKESINSNNEILSTKYYYPDDLLTISLMSTLKIQNRVGEIIKTETFRNTNLLSTKNTLYKDWGNNLIAPEIIQTSKGSGALENKIRYNTLDNTNGNPIELQQEGGAKIIYIWGYNKTLPIAKIENAAYASINPSLITAAQTASDTGTEDSLLAALTALRTGLPNAMVTTYTYIPLIGVSTITDPKGDKITYTYDSFGRLQKVKDKEGNILTENEYHYKN